MKLRILIIACFIGASTGVNSQSLLMFQDVNKDTLKSPKGPNMKKFTHFYMSYGLVLGPSDASGADVQKGPSSNFVFGYRYKRRLSNTFAVGWDLSYSTTSYRLIQDTLKVFPNPVNHDREVLFTNAFQLQLYARINFGKRGNYIGNFIDLGGYGQWDFSYRHYFQDDLTLPNLYEAEQVQVNNRKLAYTNPFNYGLIVRAGSNRFIVYGAYRLSDMFQASYNYPELSRITAGIQIGFY